MSSDFGHKSRNLMSKLGHPKDSDFNIFSISEVPFSGVGCSRFIFVTSFMTTLFHYTFQVQQMKAQNREEKMAKAQEREKLQREIAARERAEKMQVRTFN